MRKSHALASILIGLAVPCLGSVFYGKSSGTGTTLDKTITWYADEACTSTAGVVSPYSEGASAHTYVILGTTKVQGNSMFPDVPTCFGTDGVTVGAKVETRPEMNANGGVVFTFPQATIFSGYFFANSVGLVKYLGDYQLVKTSEKIEFAGNHITSAGARGVELAGSFSGDSDVDVILSGVSGDKVTATSRILLTGDFSKYKGSLTAHDMTFDPYSRNEKILDIQLLSESAMGDVSAPRADALVLANDTHLTIAPEVVQSDARGISLNITSGQTVYFNAADGKTWSLTAPLSGGEDGTLVKEGAGKVSLNGVTSVRNIVVKEGTLELGRDFAFVEGTVVTVKSGARVLTSFPEGLSIVLEDGADYGLLPIPYDPETDATQPAVLSASQTWEGKLLITLSNEIRLPFATAKRLPVLTMPTSGKRLSAEDFAGARSRDEGLPVTKFEVETDGNGLQVVYLVARPVVYASDSSTDSRKNVLTETEAWSDETAAHGGADYVIGNGAYYATASQWNNDVTFPGESLEIANSSRLIMRTVRTVFTNLVMNGGTRLQSDGCYLYSTPHEIRGKLTVRNSTFDNPVVFSGSNGTDQYGRQNRNAFNVVADVVGGGWIQFGGDPHADFSVTSKNPAYGGGFSLAVAGSTQWPIALCFADPEALGGPLEAPDYRSIAVRSSYCGLKPTASMTYDVANRGLLFFESGDFINTPSGVEFAFMNDVCMRKGVRKVGPGTLAFGGSFRFVDMNYSTVAANGTNNKLAVEEGYVKAVTTNGYAALALEFSDGAGIAMDATPSDPDVAKFGLFSAGTFTAAGRIALRLDGAGDVLAEKRSVSIPVCTVPNGTVDLTDAFVAEKIRGYACEITSEVLENGMTRYTANFSRQGFAVILR